MGDVNGHTGVLDDRGVESDAVLDDMGVMGGPRGQAPRQAIPLRASRDTMRPCAVGIRLVDLCVATGCVIFNGRAPGDEEGGPLLLAMMGWPPVCLAMGLCHGPCGLLWRGLWSPPIMGTLTITGC